MSPTQRLTVLKPVHYLLLAVLALAIFLPGFSSIPPFDRDESRFAQATRQMLETHDFVSIRFQDEARNKKPVGIHWLQSTAVSAVRAIDGLDRPDQVPIWAYRLPSLLGAVVAVLLTAWTGTRLFGATVGLGAALMMLLSVLLNVEARMAKTDAVLLATVLAAQGAMARVYLDRRKPLGPTRGLFWTFWLGLGVGILIKGPVILLPVLGTVLTLGLIDRDWTWFRRLRPLPGLLIILAMVLPWGIAIAVATKGQFFADAVGHEFLGKVNSGQEKHAGPPGYYLLTIWLSFWPGSLLVGLGALWAWRRRHDDAVRFCLAWIVPTWLIFEAVMTKLPHYVLPVFPALACLGVAALVSRADEGDSQRGAGRWVVSALYLVATLALAGVAVYASAALGTDPASPLALRLPAPLTALAPSPLGIAAGALVLATGIALLALEWHRDLGQMARMVTVGGIASMVVILGLLMPGLAGLWLSPAIADTVAANHLCPVTHLAATGYTEPSLVFLTGTRTRLGDPAQVADALAGDPACTLALVADEDHAAFAQALAAKGVGADMIRHFHGFNYSRGKWADMALFRAGVAADAAPATPAAGQP